MWETRGAHLSVIRVLPQSETLVTRTTLRTIGPVQVNYRQRMSSVFEWHGKLGTDPVAVCGIDRLGGEKREEGKETR